MLEINNYSERVYQVFLTILDSETKIDRDTNRNNTPSWNSLKHMEIMFLLEESFNIQFTEEELINLQNIDAIINLLETDNVA